jgi:thiol-disulfide isomerase/thioredoxin/sugar lactone lactonase YvrE
VAEQPARKSWAGSQPAPPFPAGLTWFNVQRPLTLEELRGRIVLLDFWTAGCINCQHIIPDLHRLEAEFPDNLVVIGVHSGKYATEHEDDTIREAIRRLGISHPVINDAEFRTWSTFGARAWPTLVLIDPAGNLVGYHEGEAVYPLFQPILASLVAEFGERGLLRSEPLPLAPGAPPATATRAYPSAVLAVDALDRLFIADAGNHRIIEATLDGRVLRVFGSGLPGLADGAPAEAAFRDPQGLAISSDGRTLFVADTRNHALRAIDLGSGETRTIAGTGRQLDQLPRGPQPARQTALASPWGLVEAAGRLYITMAGVHQIWALDLAAGTIDVFAGTSREGIDDGPRRQMATLAQPSGITADAARLYWVDPESSAVRAVPLDGEGDVTTLVGTGLFDYGDRDGSGRQAQLQHPQGIALGAGLLYIADTYNHRIRVLDPATRQLGTAAGSDRGLADGPAGEARFAEPAGLSFAAGLLHIADTANHRIRTFDHATGQVATLPLSDQDALTPPPVGSLETHVLPPQAVAPGAANLRVTVSAPAGYHLNALTPMTLDLESDNLAVLEPGDRRLRGQTNESTASFSVPVVLRPGTATLSATLSAGYCRDGEEALCFVARMELRLPIQVAADLPATEPHLEITLPER